MYKRQGEESILAPLSSEVTLRYEIADQLYAPVKSGDYIGKICYMLGEETLAERCVVAGETIGKIDYPWCLGPVSYTHLDVYKRQLCGLLPCYL